MLPRQIEYMLLFFDALGYNSGSTELSNNRRAATIINIIHLLMLAFFTFVKVHFVVGLLAWYRLMEVINFTLQFSAVLYGYWFIIFDSMLHREEHCNFWALIQRTSTLYSQQYNLSLRCYVLKVFEYFFVSFLCVTTMTSISDEQMSHFDFVYHSIINVCAIRAFYYVFCLEMLHFQLKNIDELIMQMRNEVHFAIQSHRFKSIREFYHNTYEMANFLNKIFSFSQIVIVSFCFHHIFFHMNWFYVHFGTLSMAELLSKCCPNLSNTEKNSSEPHGFVSFFQPSQFISQIQRCWYCISLKVRHNAILWYGVCECPPLKGNYKISCSDKLLIWF